VSESPFARVVLHQKPTKLETPDSGRTGLVRIATYEGGTKAVVRVQSHELEGKRTKGFTKQDGLPVKSQPVKDAAYYALAKLLRCDDIVPETLLKITRRGNDVSYQRFERALTLRDLEPALHKLEKGSDEWRAAAAQAMKVVSDEDWLKAALLGLVAADRDRHLKNFGVRVLVEGNRIVYRLVLWDNGVCLGQAFKKYRSVVHEILHARKLVFGDVLARVDDIRADDVTDLLVTNRIHPTEAQQAGKRLDFVRRYPHRMPWNILTGMPGYPAYRNFFRGGVDWRG